MSAAVTRDDLLGRLGEELTVTVDHTTYRGRLVGVTPRSAVVHAGAQNFQFLFADLVLDAPAEPAPTTRPRKPKTATQKGETT